MKILQLLQLFCIFCGALASPNLDVPLDPSKNLISRNTDPGHRLKFTVEPIRYEITLEPDLEGSIFDGKVDIAFRVNQTGLDEIIIHSQVNILSASIGETSLEWTTTDNTYHFAIFDVSSLNLDLGYHTISIVYRGDFQTDMTGFYISSYQENGQDVLLATTQFSPLFARKAFPCFDEPKYKATFLINIKCPQGYTCLSNMKVDEEKSLNTDMTSFLETPRTSTYLIAFLVSKFVPVKQSVDGQTAIWARPDAEGMGEYAFGVSEEITSYLEDFLSIKYFDPDNMKMYHVAIPDFMFGAMENWGLVTYREANLMFDENESSVKHKQRIATIMTHEITHKWFGNLVTQHWWSDLWLKEAFASYLQFNTSHNVYPEFGLDDQFVLNQVHAALRADSTLNSTPLTNPNVNSPTEVMNQFNTISYQKGATVLRMIENLIGEEAMRNGLNEYLVARSYDFATPDDFFAALDKFADLTNYNTTVKEFMGTWTLQSGYPILHVSVSHNDGGITLTQERFKQPGEPDSPEIYHIPITYSSEDELDFEDTSVDFIMTEKTMTFIDESLIDTHQWVVFNVQQTGYFRVLYDDHTYEDMIEGLNGPLRTKIHRINKAQIIDDAFNFAVIDRMSLGMVFEVIQFLEQETDFAPWTAAFPWINHFKVQFERIDGAFNEFNEHIYQLMNTVRLHLGLEPKGDYLEQFFRGNTLNLLCNLEDEGCINNAEELFSKLKSDNEPVHPDIRESVYCNGLRYGDGSDYDFLWGKYDTSNVIGEKNVILGAMGCSSDQEKIMDYLLKTLDRSSGIRDQDRMMAFSSALTSNIENIPTIFTFLKENTAAIKNIYGSVVSISSGLASRMNRLQLDELQAWAASADSGLEVDEIAIINLIITASRQEIEWTENARDEILEWITNHYKKYDRYHRLQKTKMLPSINRKKV